MLLPVIKTLNLFKCKGIVFGHILIIDDIKIKINNETNHRSRTKHSVTVTTGKLQSGTGCIT
jgi:hypothetical protein